MLSDLSVDSLRAEVVSGPLWLFLALAAVYYACQRFLARTSADRSVSRWTGRAAMSVSVIALAFYLTVSVWYAAVPQQFDAAEPTMTSVAWLFSVGKPVYHSVDSAERYAHMYGPAAFVVPGLVLRLAGPTMLAAKGVGVVSAILALALTWAAMRGLPASPRHRTFILGLCAMEFLTFGNQTFWSRPEPLQLLCVAAALAAAAGHQSLPRLTVIAVSLAILWNLKFSGPLYSLPVLALVWTTSGRAAAIRVLAAAALLSLLPFVIFPNVSLSDYLRWVRLSGRSGLRLSGLKENIGWAMFFLVPVMCAAMRVSSRPRDRHLPPFIAALLVGICGVVVAAAKPGAGPYHLVPFLPLIAYALAGVTASWHTVDTSYRPALAAFLTTTAFVAAVEQAYFLRGTADRELRGSYREVEAFIAAHPLETVQMGYTSAVRKTFARTLLTFHDGTYLLDAPAIQEHQLAGIALPPATIEAIRSCAVSSWLLPRPGEPFVLPNAYPATGHASLFPDAFTDAFHAAYRREEQTHSYDVWRCKK